MERCDPLMGDWSTNTTSSRWGIASIRVLLPEPATPVMATSTPSGMSIERSRRLFVVGVLDRDRPGRPTNVGLDCLTLLEVTTCRCVGLAELCDGACEAHGAASGAGPRCRCR